MHAHVHGYGRWYNIRLRNNLNKLSEEEINEYSCLFLDLNALDKCKTCFLSCQNNKNPDLNKKEKR